MFSAQNLGPSACTCSQCGAVLWFHERIKKGSTISTPLFSICCRKGKVQLPLYQACPQYLMNLVRYNSDQRGRKFRENIRAYNSIFSFTSKGGHVDSSINGQSAYIFRINGQNYHRVGSLLPMTGKPKFEQLYFYDTENEVENRLTAPGANAKDRLDV